MNKQATVTQEINYYLLLFVFRLYFHSETAGDAAALLPHAHYTSDMSGNMATQYYQDMQESFKNNNKSREFPAHTAKVHSVAWSCDGRRLASGSFDKTASVFVLEKDRLVSSVFS